MQTHSEVKASHNDVNHLYIGNNSNFSITDAEMDGDAMIGAYEAGPDSLSSIVPSLGKRLKLSRLLKKEMEGMSKSTVSINN